MSHTAHLEAISDNYYTVTPTLITWQLVVGPGADIEDTILIGSPHRWSLSLGGLLKIDLPLPVIVFPHRYREALDCTETR